MATTGQDRGEEAIRALLAAYHTAMVAGRTDALGKLLDDGFALTHITGYVQPKDEWFDVIRAGQFDYHRIDMDSRALSVSVTGDSATVSGRGIFDATINGMHAPWRLEFRMTCAKEGGRWRIASARYTSF